MYLRIVPHLQLIIMYMYEIYRIMNEINRKEDILCKYGSTECLRKKEKGYRYCYKHIELL